MVRLVGVACVVGLLGCYGKGAPKKEENKDTASTAPMGSEECKGRCAAHRERCDGEDDCASLCGERVSRAAIRCVEALACDQASTAAKRACVKDNPEVGDVKSGVFGDSCTCAGGEAECRGGCEDTLLCAAGLCVGPVCCEGSSCDGALGTAEGCGQGRVCGCTDGSSNCTRGVCVADH